MVTSEDHHLHLMALHLSNQAAVRVVLVVNKAVSEVVVADTQQAIKVSVQEAQAALEVQVAMVLDQAQAVATADIHLVDQAKEAHHRNRMALHVNRSLHQQLVTVSHLDHPQVKFSLFQSCIQCATIEINRAIVYFQFQATNMAHHHSLNKVVSHRLDSVNFDILEFKKILGH